MRQWNGTSRPVSLDTAPAVQNCELGPSGPTPAFLSVLYHSLHSFSAVRQEFAGERALQLTGALWLGEARRRACMARLLLRQRGVASGWLSTSEQTLASLCPVVLTTMPNVTQDLSSVHLVWLTRHYGFWQSWLSCTELSLHRGVEPGCLDARCVRLCIGASGLA